MGSSLKCNAERRRLILIQGCCHSQSRRSDAGPLFIAKGSPWDNGYVESFNGMLRDEFLNRELFLSMEEACWVIDRWQLNYNHRRIHSALDHQTSAAYATDSVPPAAAAPQPPEQSRST